MKFETKFLNEIEIEENKVINFKNGMPGFEDLNKFAILDIDDSNFKCLQSLQDKNICLLLITPWDYYKEYEIELSDDEIKDLDLKNESDVLVYNVITVREDKVTANFLSPIVVNTINNNAKQIILANNNYSIRQELKCLY